MPSYYDENQKTWYCKFYYTDQTGQRKQKLKRGFPRQRDAKDWERNFLGRQQGSLDMAFKSLCELHLKDSRKNCKLSNYKVKESLCDTHTLPYFKDKPINKIRPADIRKWQNTIKKSISSEIHQKDVSQRFSSIMNFTVRYYGLRKNPCSITGSISRRKVRKMDFWILDELSRFIVRVNGLPLKMAYLVLFYAGLRLGESLVLTRNDLSVPSRILTTSRTYHRYDRADLITSPKTGNSYRTITLPPLLVDALSDYIERNYDMQPGNRLFSQVTEFKLRYWKKEACNASGVKVIRLHDIRHSHVSLLIDVGFFLHLVAEHIRDTVQMVNEVYGHLYPNRHVEVANKLQEIVSL